MPRVSDAAETAALHKMNTAFALDTEAYERSMCTMPVRRFPSRPPRLPFVFPDYDPPLYFVTFGTWDRLHLLGNEEVHNAFRTHAFRGLEDRAIEVGRYTIMPDHVHLFVRGGPDFRLAKWIGGLKKSMGKPIRERQAMDDLWQPGCFDHIVRHTESYDEKWAYVRENPVRAGLVRRAEEWPFQGEIVKILHR